MRPNPNKVKCNCSFVMTRLLQHATYEYWTHAFYVIFMINLVLAYRVRLGIALSMHHSLKLSNPFYLFFYKIFSSFNFLCIPTTDL